jgi:hypothetical protein
MMGMRLSLYVGFLVILASACFAAPIKVRSGAHETFSRLVLDVPTGTEWEIKSSGKSASIRLIGHQDGFDISNVFDRIETTHISGVTSMAGEIDIMFACDCTAAAFAEGDRMVVVDIANAPGVSAVIIKPKDTERAEIKPTFDAFVPALKPKRVPTAFLEPASSFGLIKKRDPQALESSASAQELTNLSQARLAEAKQKIVAQVSAAATRGLLQPKTRPIDLPLIPEKQQADPQIFDSSAIGIAEADSTSVPRSDNLRISSSSDIPLDDRLNQVVTNRGVRCIAADFTDVGSWGTDQLFSEQIATLRNTLYSEFDRLNIPAATALARTYLHFGFGAEARQIISIHPDVANENPVLLELSDIMEYGNADTSDYLHHFAECDSDLALWAILARSEVDLTKNINAKAALRAAARLPIHLRNFIAPELSRRFLFSGDTDMAEAALRSLERTEMPLSSNANLAKADIELAQGKVDQARGRLSDVVSSNDEQAAEALIKFVDSHPVADAPIDENIATLVEAYALQMRDDPIGAKLRRTHVLALGKSGQFNAAFAAMDRIRDTNASGSDPELDSSILSLLTENANDIDFLDHAFDRMPAVVGAVAPAVGFQVAARLVTLGFPTEAERILSQHPDLADTTNTKFLMAEIALALSRPFEAEAAVFDFTSEQANRIRAEAKRQSGAFDQAHNLFSDLGEASLSLETAWLAQDWAALVKDTAPVFGDIARVANTSLPDNPELNGMLSRTAATLTESAQARGVIRNLLRSMNERAPPSP